MHIGAETHPCHTNNGNCDHLCMPQQLSKFVCMCGSGFSLDAGSNKCELYRDSFLIVASKNKILGIPYAFFC